MEAVIGLAELPAKYRELVQKYEQIVEKHVALSEKYLDVAEKYSKAINDIANLKERSNFDRQYAEALVAKYGPLTHT